TYDAIRFYQVGRQGSSTREAKNALLFIGDGMAPTMISAARYISKNTKFGKFANGDGFLEIEKWDSDKSSHPWKPLDLAENVPFWNAINRTNYYDAYANAGYNVVYDKNEMKRVLDGPVLGIFTKGHMVTWCEREFNADALSTKTDSSPKLDKTTAKNQPGLELMTLKAIEIMETNALLTYLLFTATTALLEFDRTLKSVRALPAAKETAIFLTADYSQGYDVYGTVDLNYFRAGSAAPGTDLSQSSASWHADQRQAIGIYEESGWIDDVLDSNGLPTKFADARYRLASGKVDMPAHDDHQVPSHPQAGRTTPCYPSTFHTTWPQDRSRRFPGLGIPASNATVDAFATPTEGFLSNGFVGV
ncbi:hypothetical protein HDU98_000664, partial [Podochytrium sp. JEL0797]